MAENQDTPRAPEVSQEELYRQINEYVTERLRAGDGRDAVVAKLVAQKVEPELANQIVDAIYEAELGTAKKEQMTGDEILPGIGAGLLSAIVGGIVWGLIVLATDYEIGYMAWGIGLLSGYAVLFAAGGKKGRPLQVTAVISSLLGILIGKYFVFYQALKNEVVKAYGAEAARNIKFYSSQVLGFFFDNIGSMLTGHDAIWVLLAIVTAWSLLQRSAVRTTE